MHARSSVMVKAERLVIKSCQVRNVLLRNPSMARRGWFTIFGVSRESCLAMREKLKTLGVTLNSTLPLKTMPMESYNYHICHYAISCCLTGDAANSNCVHLKHGLLQLSTVQRRKRSIGYSVQINLACVVNSVGTPDQILLICCVMSTGCR